MIVFKYIFYSPSIRIKKIEMFINDLGKSTDQLINDEIWKYAFYLKKFDIPFT